MQTTERAFPLQYYCVELLKATPVTADIIAQHKITLREIGQKVVVFLIISFLSVVGCVAPICQSVLDRLPTKAKDDTRDTVLPLRII